MIAGTDPGRAAWGSTERGSTERGSTARGSTAPGYHRSERTAPIGRGDADWAAAGDAVLRWRVKTESGFRVDDDRPVTAGKRQLVTARLFGVTIVEPVEVVEVVRTPTRVGFSYRTRPGHPVDGEEAFVVHRDGDDVLLTIRSLTRAAPQQPWRTLFPVLRIAQVVARRRYLRALVHPSRGH